MEQSGYDWTEVEVAGALDVRVVELLVLNVVEGTVEVISVEVYWLDETKLLVSDEVC